MRKTFIIAEAACTWLHGGLEAAYRSIKAAKECGADAWKTQWTSNPIAMAKRRGADPEKYFRLGWDHEWLPLLAARCKEYGLSFMCTTFIPRDVDLIAPHVYQYKVSAFECNDMEHLSAHGSRPVIVSVNPGKAKPVGLPGARFLWCISRYPAEPESLELSRLHHQDGLMPWDGFSDHTTSTLTGAVAVGAGARIIEKHVRLSDTPVDDPDYGHSLVVDFADNGFLARSPYAFKTYVDNIREAERML
jgi:sialic acid synthase SpsE